MLLLYMKQIRAIGCASRGRSYDDWYTSEHRQMLELNSDKFSNAISGVTKDYMIALLYETE